MTYLLDSDVFIRASNLHYGFDFCPAFWDWLEQMNADEKVYSVSQVYAELQPGADDLADWAKQSALFNDIDKATLDALESITRWLNIQPYEPTAINTFLQVADAMLIAYALAHKHIVVTHEAPADSVKKIKIPNVCIGMNVLYMNPFEMLRRERAKFILDMSSKA